MPTEDEIEQRIDADDNPLTARRKTITKNVNELGAQIADVSAQLHDLIVQVRQEIGDNQDIITVEKLAAYTDIPKAELKDWLTGYKPSANKRKRQPSGETDNEHRTSHKLARPHAASSRHDQEGVTATGTNGVAPELAPSGMTA